MTNALILQSLISLETNFDHFVNKQGWNKDKYRCEWKKWIDKGSCDKGFIWNPGKCECKCDKSCDVLEYLNYEKY